MFSINATLFNQSKVNGEEKNPEGAFLCGWAQGDRLLVMGLQVMGRKSHKYLILEALSCRWAVSDWSGTNCGKISCSAGCFEGDKGMSN